jgi:hypothetical protein
MEKIKKISRLYHLYFLFYHVPYSSETTVWWLSMDQDIGEFIKSCGKCQENRTDVHPKPDLLTSLPICTEPNQRIHADLFGALTTSEKNKKYILCMTNAFSKYVELVAISQMPFLHIGSVDMESQLN